MSVFRNIAEAAGSVGPCALTIGNFDGVHAGHQELINHVCAVARDAGIASAALTFYPHPLTVIAPDRAPVLLDSIETRIERLQHAGIEKVVILPFTPEIARTTAEDFVSQILVEALSVRTIMVGSNFRFGYQQSGNVQLLEAMGREFGFSTNFIEPVVRRSEIVSSSCIRRYLAAGNVSRANRLLNRCFQLSGPVVSGEGIGSKQTVPTLNILPGPQLVPRHGVYISETFDQDNPRRHWQSITNVGQRPTFGGDRVTIETFLLSPFDGETPAGIDIDLRLYLRPEKQFPDAAALRVQIMKDVGKTQFYWHTLNRLRFRSTIY